VVVWEEVDGPCEGVEGPWVAGTSEWEQVMNMVDLRAGTSRDDGWASVE
jgi:hypothetical protein